MLGAESGRLSEFQEQFNSFRKNLPSRHQEYPLCLDEGEQQEGRFTSGAETHLLTGSPFQTYVVNDGVHNLIDELSEKHPAIS